MGSPVIVRLSNGETIATSGEIQVVGRYSFPGPRYRFGWESGNRESSGSSRVWVTTYRLPGLPEPETLPNWDGAEAVDFRSPYLFALVQADSESPPPGCGFVAEPLQDGRWTWG